MFGIQQFGWEKKIENNTCLYIGVNKDCNGHYNKDGNKLLADYVFNKFINKE